MTHYQTFKNLDLGEDDCRIVNNLFSEKLRDAAGHLYSHLKVGKKNGLVKIHSHITQLHTE